MYYLKFEKEVRMEFVFNTETLTTSEINLMILNGLR